MKKFFTLLVILQLCSIAIFSQLEATITDSTMAGENNLPFIVTGTFFLPDGSGQSYSTNINFDAFPSGQLITDAGDIFSIGINMEHSYAGDLTMKIICPNGQYTNLLLYPNGLGSSYLGEPIDSDQNMNPGTGYFYNWIMDASTVMIPNTTIPAGNYLPVDPMSFGGLVGCPLNGTWGIQVTDNLNSDNGYIFSWQINFNPLIIPSGYNSGSATVTASGGVPPYTYYWSNGVTTPTINHLAPGIYFVTVYDSNTGKVPNTATNQVTITQSTTSTVNRMSEDGVNISFSSGTNNLQVSVNTNKESSADIHIYNKLGQTVYAGSRFLGKGKNYFQIDTADLSIGLYFFRIEEKGAQPAIYKFVK